MPGGLGKLLKKAMVISMEDQVAYCNRTIQVGPHLLVVTCATLDATGGFRLTSALLNGRQ